MLTCSDDLAVACEWAAAGAELEPRNKTVCRRREHAEKLDGSFERGDSVCPFLVPRPNFAPARGKVPLMQSCCVCRSGIVSPASGAAGSRICYKEISL